MTANFPEEYLTRIIALFNKYESVEHINCSLKERTGIKDFFKSSNELERYKKVIKNLPKIDLDNKDLGDFQTPSQLTDRICKHFVDINFKPNVVLEPTSGTGNFVVSALKFFPTLKYLYCVEALDTYEVLFKLNLLKLSFEQKINANIKFYQDNIYTHGFSGDFLNILDDKSLNFLILGNPPWVTNTQLSMLNSDNLPSKSNIKGLRGIDAITGKANFDIAEYIILLMIQKFSYRKGKIAMLCKGTVIRNLVRDMRKLSLKINNLQTLKIDAKREFGVSADGALFVADIGTETGNSCTVTSIYDTDTPNIKIGWFDNKFVSNIELYKKHKYLDGKSPFEWRQGVKHDASKVLILKSADDGLLTNDFDENIYVEDKLLYPFVKGSELKEAVINDTNKKLIITQKSPKEDTEYIRKEFPKLWKYLISHSNHFENRKSTIYKGRARFSIFGIGDYSFKPYKIAVSGFYKKPNFVLVLPIDNKPVMLDDTCYFLSFDTLNDAFFPWILLNLKKTKDFLESIVFINSKRPYTKEILMRIDLQKLLERVTFEDLLNFYPETNNKIFKHTFTKNDYLSFKNSIHLGLN